MTITKKITRNSAAILIPSAIVSAFLPWENLPFSILAGGLLGILNIRAISWSVEGLAGESSATMKMLFFSQFRFVITALIIAVLAYLRLANLIGITAGFSVVFSQVLIVGYRNARSAEKDGRSI